LFIARRSGLQTLWSLSTSGQESARQILHDRSAIPPAVSPDGSRVLFATRTERGFAVVICGLPACRDVRQLSLSTLHASWTADGQAVTYLPTTDNRNLWVQPLAGGEPRPLTHFTDEQILNFEWSPDGQRIAISRGLETNDVVLVRHIDR